MSKKIIYFAYGSNMNTEIIRSESRVPSAKTIGRARLLNKLMVCNKESKDGSSKANLVDSPGDIVWGVLYEINSSEIGVLDRVEGGYRRTTLEVLNDSDDTINAEVYISTIVTTDLPYDCYKKLILEGARKHQLPNDYLEYLEQLPSKADPHKRQCNFI
ncbi:MAG: gamma-glutamylcyclotransferase [Deltaproteobacteria bacterium]|nr:gamma-glutamylcyclotransferase [Deltaproteobacteria bacterium]